MATNPYTNKVELSDGTTLVDLTGDTATASDVVRGETFHLASGAQATGTMDVAGAITDAQVDSVLADSAPTGTDSLRLSQLTRFWDGLKTKFAALVHYHTALGNASTTVISVNTTLRSVAEGNSTSASDQAAHAEGYSTTASAPRAHAEGYLNTASGTDSHAEGSNNVASGIESHVEGTHNIASSQAQHVGGRYNVEDSLGTYAEIIGNGTVGAGGVAVRSNARTLDWDGNAWHAGEVSATEHVSGGSDVTHNLTAKANTSDMTTALNGKANSSHSHAASDITSGQLAIANGGTGASTAAGAKANIVDGQALTPASVAATGAVSGSSISDGTGTLAQLRESVSRTPTLLVDETITHGTSKTVSVSDLTQYRTLILYLQTGSQIVASTEIPSALRTAIATLWRVSYFDGTYHNAYIEFLSSTSVKVYDESSGFSIRLVGM